MDGWMGRAERTKLEEGSTEKTHGEAEQPLSGHEQWMGIPEKTEAARSYSPTSLPASPGLPHERQSQQATLSVLTGVSGVQSARGWISFLRRCIPNLLPLLIGVAALRPRVL